MVTKLRNRLYDCVLDMVSISSGDIEDAFVESVDEDEIASRLQDVIGEKLAHRMGEYLDDVMDEIIEEVADVAVTAELDRLF